MQRNYFEAAFWRRIYNMVFLKQQLLLNAGFKSAALTNKMHYQ